MNKKKSLLLLLALLLFILAYSSTDQLQKSTIKRVYGIHENKFTRIPPPFDFLAKSTAAATCDIQVKYVDFSNEAKTAFEYAVSIWESLLHSDQVIKVEAHWMELPSEGSNSVLGAAGASNFYINKDGLPQNNVFYNAPLAEKLVHMGLNGSNVPDIYAYFNSTAEWYYGIDGQTPAGKFDLVSVVLHELCHGVGFLGSMGVTDEKQGIWSYGSFYPFIYDKFLYNGNHQQLIDSTNFVNPSAELYQQLTGGDLYFDGPVLKAKSGSWASLYAPNPFDDGSSIDHLGKIYDDTENTLMTPGMHTASSIHDPGKITLGILEDLGWSSVHLHHYPVPNQESLTDIQIYAEVIPDFDTDLIDPRLYYSINHGAWQEKTLTATTEDSVYTSTIELSQDSEVQFFLSVKDKYGRIYYSPNSAPEKPDNILIGADTVAPVISHIPNNFFLAGDTNLVLLCNVVDLLDVDTVYVEYAVNGMDKTPAGLMHLTRDVYNTVLDLSLEHLKIGDTLSYRLVAKDGSLAGNVKYSPAEGFYNLRVSQLPEYIQSYETGFESGYNEFIMNGFDLFTAPGFSNPALNSEHPYENGGTDTWLDFTAEFVFPIKIDALYHFISFDEIALVEPGDAGTVYGDEDFFDYVIVEGSNDNGKTWIPFEGGWDCRLHSEWVNAYNQSLNYNNSEILNELNLYRRHLIDLTAPAEFSAGDVIRIRFRLNSDPFAVGWGWAIDNLRVQTVGLSVPTVNTPAINVYPNPVINNEFIISGINEKINQMKIYDYSGRLVYQQKNVDVLNKIYIPNDLKGLHILYLEGKNNAYRSKLFFK